VSQRKSSQFRLNIREMPWYVYHQNNLDPVPLPGFFGPPTCVPSKVYARTGSICFLRHHQLQRPIPGPARSRSPLVATTLTMLPSGVRAWMTDVVCLSREVGVAEAYVVMAKLPCKAEHRAQCGRSQATIAITLTRAPSERQQQVTRAEMLRPQSLTHSEQTALLHPAGPGPTCRGRSCASGGVAVRSP
jgi:hypothetical protein